MKWVVIGTAILSGLIAGWCLRGDRVVAVGSCELEARAAVLDYRLQAMEQARTAMLHDLGQMRHGREGR